MWKWMNAGPSRALAVQAVLYTLRCIFSLVSKLEGQVLKNIK